MGEMKMKMKVVIFFNLIIRSISVLNPVDYVALQSIHASLRDLPGSTFLASWDFTTDPCATFPGLACSGDRVISLSLGSLAAGSPGLSGYLHPSLGRLSSLSSLSLVPGRVSGPIPSSLSQVHNLRFLALSQNYLYGEIPPSFSRFRELKTLDLSFNILSGRIPPIPNLSNLILCHNRFTGNVPDLTRSPSLARLDLKRNNLSGDLPPIPASLHYLALSFNRLSGRIDHVVSRLATLNYLDLSANKFTGSIPPSIFSSPVNAVFLQRNQFEGPVRVARPAGLGLKVVDLSYNRLSGTVPEGLAGVERIYLNFNRFEGVVPRKFGEGLRRGEIRVLFLQHNFLRGMEIGGVVPEQVTLCLNFNCMAPPLGTVCPVRVGQRKRRPEWECNGLKKCGLKC